MISYLKIIEIYCVIDEFCQEYDQIVDNALLGNPPKGPAVMSSSEMITITVLFHLGGFRIFKHFHVYYLQKHMHKEFPRTVSYNRFAELMQRDLLIVETTLKKSKNNKRFKALVNKKYREKVLGF